MEREHSATLSIYAASTNPTLWPDALQQIADCTDDRGSLLIWARDDGSFGTVTSASLAEAQADYQANWATRDLRAQRAVERSFWLPTDVVCDHDVASEEEIDGHPLYTEFLAKHGLRWVAAIGVSPDPSLHAALSVQRALTKQPYTAPEKALIRRLGRHVERSLRIGMELMDARATIASLGDVLRRLRAAVFTLDAHDAVVFMNDAARELLDGPLVLARGRLVVAYQGQLLSLDAASRLQRAGSPPNGDATPLLLHRDDGGRLVVFMMPFSVDDGIAEGFLVSSRRIVLVVSEGRDAPPDLSVLRDLFGLTTAEARLAAVVGQGASPREAAAGLSITEQTARTVLKRIFSKTGTSRQSELSVLIGKVGLRV